MAPRTVAGNLEDWDVGDAMPEPSAPPEIDSTVPSVARAYDYALGGKDNYAVDRDMLAHLKQIAPEIALTAVDNRAFLIRVTRFLASQAGITQFLDCGSGLPTAENTHQVAQRINREATVVYVDNDPTVIAHGRALLEENEQTHLLSADLTRPEQILEHEQVRKALDFTEPIALFQLGTLHHHPDEVNPREIMRAYVDALPSGSYVALTHFLNPGGQDGEVVTRLREGLLEKGLDAGYFRRREEIESLFDGLEMVAPGLSVLEEWWPDGPRLRELVPIQRCLIGGIGRKP